MQNNRTKSNEPAYNVYNPALSEQLPQETLFILKGHSDKIRHCAYSNNGQWLASCSEDKTVIIWDLATRKVKFQLTGHEAAVLYCAWSPADDCILTCDPHAGTFLWSLKDGKCMQQYRSGGGTTSCAWLPDASGFLTCGRHECIYLWSKHGKIMSQWNSEENVMDIGFSGLVVSKDGTRCWAVGDYTNQNDIDVMESAQLKLFALPELKEVASETFAGYLPTLTLSKDETSVLVVLDNDEPLHVFDAETLKLQRTLSGQNAVRGYQHSDFGGKHGELVASGSASGKVYIRAWPSGEIVAMFKGHPSTTTTVCWNPAKTTELASASMDCTIRVWGRPGQEVEGEAAKAETVVVARPPSSTPSPVMRRLSTSSLDRRMSREKGGFILSSIPTFASSLVHVNAEKPKLDTFVEKKPLLSVEDRLTRIEVALEGVVRRLEALENKASISSTISSPIPGKQQPSIRNGTLVSNNILTIQQQSGEHLTLDTLTGRFTWKSELSNDALFILQVVSTETQAIAHTSASTHGRIKLIANNGRMVSMVPAKQYGLEVNTSLAATQEEEVNSVFRVQIVKDGVLRLWCDVDATVCAPLTTKTGEQLFVSCGRIPTPKCDLVITVTHTL